MKIIPLSLLLLSTLQICFAPPVTQNKDKENDEVVGLEDYMEYHRYLREVVNALESDPQFREKLEKAQEHDIRSGKIAEELEFVSHHVRSRLDEIKRVELNRLRDLTEKKMRLQQNLDLEDPSHKHLDHSNPHTFEIDDLKKLIAKTTADLMEADKKRKEEFKQYELQKEFEKQIKINHTNGDEREKLEREYKVEREEKHKKHEKLHEPGHKAQLEEVWMEQDQMQQEFDPKTFFMLHDIDSNGLWDQDEVKALFIKELEKMYAAGEPEDDMRERAEEMERMRESVFQEVDLNRDGFIDYQEFLAQTKRNDFQQDHGWQGLDEKRPYTDEEFEQYMRQRQANQMAQGYPPTYHQVPVHPNGVPIHPGALPPQQFHPGQYPQQHLPDLNTNEIYPNQQNNYQYQHEQPQYHQQVPIQNQQVPIRNQQIPLQNQQIPMQNQHVPMQNQQIPMQNQQVPMQNRQVPMQNQQVPMQNQQVPVRNQQVPNQNQQIPVQNQIPIQNQQVPVQNQIPVQNQQVPVQNQQVPPQNPQVPVQSQQVPQQNQVPLQNLQSQGQNQQQFEGGNIQQNVRSNPNLNKVESPQANQV